MFLIMVVFPTVAVVLGVIYGLGQYKYVPFKAAFLTIAIVVGATICLGFKA